MRVRAAEPGELSVLQDIERAAGQLFCEIGMTEIAEDEPMSLDELAGYQRAGRAWVVADATAPPVAYLLTDLVDGAVHIEQLSVHPGSARRRLGRSLIEHVAVLAKADGLPALTLTTFTQVPWNAPYYLRCGFRCLDEAELTQGLREIRRHEFAQGLDRWPRVCMRREL